MAQFMAWRAALVTNTETPFSAPVAGDVEAGGGDAPGATEDGGLPPPGAAAVGADPVPGAAPGAAAGTPAGSPAGAAASGSVSPVSGGGAAGSSAAGSPVVAALGSWGIESSVPCATALSGRLNTKLIISNQAPTNLATRRVVRLEWLATPPSVKIRSVAI